MTKAPASVRATENFRLQLADFKNERLNVRVTGTCLKDGHTDISTPVDDAGAANVDMREVKFLNGVPETCPVDVLVRAETLGAPDRNFNQGFLGGSSFEGLQQRILSTTIVP